MAKFYHLAGLTGLRLRSEREVRSIPLARRGPLGGTYETAAALEIAEAGRVVAEIALDLPGTLCIAVDDGAALLARTAGDPNPQYTLYRLAAVQLGEEPQIRWGTAERLEAMLDLCDIAPLWQLATPTVSATAEDDCSTPTGWTLRQPVLAARLDDPLDSRAGWTITPDSIPTSGTPANGGDLGQTTTTPADTTYGEATAGDWGAAVAGGWKQQLRWWANSHGPYSTTINANTLAAWHTLWPGVRWTCTAAAHYFRSAANAQGAVFCPDGAQCECTANAQTGYSTAQAWTLFVVAYRKAGQTQQGVLFGAGSIATQYPGTPAYDISLLSGSESEGMRVCWGTQASRTWTAALSPTAYQIAELSVAAGAAVGTWTLQLDGVAQPASAAVNGDAVPGALLPDQYRGFRGWENSPGGPFKGSIAEILLLQTDAPAPRAAVRSYLAAKFAITLP